MKLLHHNEIDHDLDLYCKCTFYTYNCQQELFRLDVKLFFNLPPLDKLNDEFYSQIRRL